MSGSNLEQSLKEATYKKSYSSARNRYKKQPPSMIEKKTTIQEEDYENEYDEYTEDDLFSLQKEYIDEYNSHLQSLHKNTIKIGDNDEYSEETSSENNEKLELIEVQMENLKYTNDLKSINQSSFIPHNCNRVCFSNVWIETTGTLNNPIQINDWHIDTPEEAKQMFGSTSDYAQGVEIKVSNVKQGRLDNVYVCELNITRITNGFPFSIGVEVGELQNNNNTSNKNTEINFIPYPNANEFHSNKLYHGIIPALCNNNNIKIRLFKNTVNINHEYGVKFPWLTENESDIKKGVKPSLNNFAVPCESPIMFWIVHNVAFYKNTFGWELPLPNPSDETFYDVPSNMLNEAVKQIKLIVKQHLPVMNLNNFYIKFTPLINNTDSQINFSDILLKKHLLNIKSKSEINNSTYNEDNDFIFKSGLSFLLNSMHVFRDLSIDYKEFDEENENNNNIHINNLNLDDEIYPYDSVSQIYNNNNNKKKIIEDKNSIWN